MIPPSPARLRLQVHVLGTLRLPSGDVNLVATQLALDREHANLITFQSEQTGLDPLVDLVMNGGDLRVAIKVGYRHRGGAQALSLSLRQEVLCSVTEIRASTR